MSQVQDIEQWVQFSSENTKAKMRLICFHHMGGSAQFFRSWSTQLPDNVQLCLVQLPGRWDRIHEEPFTDMKSLIVKLQKTFEGILSLPFAVLGYSFGARVAFEFVRSLRRCKSPMPFAFFALAARASLSARRKAQLIHRPSDEQLLKILSEDFGALPEVVLQNEEMLKVILKPLRADWQILESYRYKAEAPFDFPIVALGGAEDRSVDLGGLKDWRQHTTGEFSFEMFKGAHFFAEESQAEVLKCICQFMNRYTGDGEDKAAKAI